jgi:hypothetical protein
MGAAFEYIMGLRASIMCLKMRWNIPVLVGVYLLHETRNVLLQHTCKQVAN